MPERSFASGTGLQIEVDEVGSGSSGNYANELGKAVDAVARQLDILSESEEGAGAAEVSIEFRLIAGINGGFVIPIQQDRGNFVVRAKWKKPEPPPIQEIPVD